MRKIFIFIILITFTYCIVGCDSKVTENEAKDIMETEYNEEITNTNNKNIKEVNEMKNETIKIKITVDGNTATAVLENNSTSRAFVEKLPVTLPMMDLYSREMCYRFDEQLPADNLISDSYNVGDIAYWPPRHSFVILYKQNGEKFERQHLGHIDSGIEFFNNIGDTDVTFEIIE